MVNIDRCWGCKACQTACKWEHDLQPAGALPMEVLRVEIPAQPQARCEFVPMMCMHCDQADCISACPKDAISRNEEGIVVISAQRCIGCGLCEKACDYGAISFYKDETGARKAAKCDMCAERRARGFMTSCEQHCLGGALTSCPASQLEELVAPFPYRWSVGRTVYVSTRLSNLNEFLAK